MTPPQSAAHAATVALRRRSGVPGAAQVVEPFRRLLSIPLRDPWTCFGRSRLFRARSERFFRWPEFERRTPLVPNAVRNDEGARTQICNSDKWGSCLSTVATTGCVLRLFGWLLTAETSLAVLRRHFPASDRRAFPDGAISCG